MAWRQQKLSPGSVWVITDILHTSCAVGINHEGDVVGPVVRVTVAGGPNVSEGDRETPPQLMEIIMREHVARQLRDALDHDGCAGA